MTDSFRPTLLRNKAWEALRNKWLMAAVVGLILFAISMVVSTPRFFTTTPLPHITPAFAYTSFISFALTLLVVSIADIGALFLFWDVSNGKSVEVETLLEPFKSYGRYLLGYLLVFIYVILWWLLLIIPGIIKSISYSMTFYIMRENPEMSGEMAIQRSMAMMRGHKMDYFLLMLSFIGWILLGIITLGIGFLFIFPYMYTASGAFYEELKKDYAARQELHAQPAV